VLWAALVFGLVWLGFWRVLVLLLFLMLLLLWWLMHCEVLAAFTATTVSVAV